MKNTQNAVFISILSDFNRARGETYAESIVERFAHNTTWIETGDVNMRQYLSHAWWPGLDCDQPLLNGDTHALNALQRMG